MSIYYRNEPQVSVRTFSCLFKSARAPVFRHRRDTLVIGFQTDQISLSILLVFDKITATILSCFNSSNITYGDFHEHAQLRAINSHFIHRARNEGKEWGTDQNSSKVPRTCKSCRFLIDTICAKLPWRIYCFRCQRDSLLKLVYIAQKFLDLLEFGSENNVS